MKKFRFLIILLFGCTQFNAFCKTKFENIACLNFNSNWAFYRGDIKNAEAANFNDKDWNAITIPHTMRLEKKHCGGGDNYQGIGWYRRYFKIPKAYKNKKIEVFFDGVQTNCDVFLNDEKLKSHFGGYIGFVVDLTNKVRFDKDNVLAVRVSNMDDPLTPPGKELRQLDFNYYGGIYRNVKMHITNKVYISDPLQANQVAGGGLFVSYTSISSQSAQVNIKTHVINETEKQCKTKLLTTITDSSGAIVGRVENTYTIKNKSDVDFIQTVTVSNPKDVCYKVTNSDGSDPMPEMPFITREWGDNWQANPKDENSSRASRIYSEKGLLAMCEFRQKALCGDTYWDHGKLDANPRISGYFVWSFNDYPRGYDLLTAFSGVVDIDRYPKFGYYQLQSMQNGRNPVYEPMVYIASYNNNPNLDSSIMVFSNCDKVKLYRNSKFINEITRTENAKTAPTIAARDGNPYFKFNLGTYEPGELKAEGIINDKVYTHTVKTPGKPHHLEIEMADVGIKPIADGSDMIPFYIKVCDEHGTVVSNTQQFQSFALQVSITGEGELIGADIPRIQLANQKTEGGIGYGIIRTSDKPGKITITAISQGLITGKTNISSIPTIDKMVTDGTHEKTPSFRCFNLKVHDKKL